MAKMISLTANPIPSRSLVQLPLTAAKVHDWLTSADASVDTLARGRRSDLPRDGRLHVSWPMVGARSVLYAVRLTAGEGSHEVLFRGWIRLLSGPGDVLALCVEGRERAPGGQRPTVAAALARLIADRCLEHAQPQPKGSAARREALAG